jgi:hypothetical protein
MSAFQAIHSFRSQNVLFLENAFLASNEFTSIKASGRNKFKRDMFWNVMAKAISEAYVTVGARTLPRTF